jgi:hypothetical protein
MSFFLPTSKRSFAPFAFAAAFVLAIYPTGSALAADYQELGVIGKWRLTKALDSADITSRDEREARQLLGRVVTISKEAVKFGSDDCPAPKLEAQLVAPGPYVREWFHASSENLGLPNPVTVVDLGCANVFIKGKQRIVVFWDGWFFDAKRMR